MRCTGAGGLNFSKIARKNEQGIRCRFAVILLLGMITGRFQLTCNVVSWHNLRETWCLRYERKGRVFFQHNKQKVTHVPSAAWLPRCNQGVFMSALPTAPLTETNPNPRLRNNWIQHPAKLSQDTPARHCGSYGSRAKYFPVRQTNVMYGGGCVNPIGLEKWYQPNYPSARSCCKSARIRSSSSAYFRTC